MSIEKFSRIQALGSDFRSCHETSKLWRPKGLSQGLGVVLRPLTNKEWAGMGACLVRLLSSGELFGGCLVRLLSGELVGGCLVRLLSSGGLIGGPNTFGGPFGRGGRVSCVCLTRGLGLGPFGRGGRVSCAPGLHFVLLFQHFKC